MVDSLGQGMGTSSSSSTSQSESSGGMVNLDDTIFEPEIPSSALKDLIEE